MADSYEFDCGRGSEEEMNCRLVLVIPDYAGGSGQHCCPRTCRTALAAAANVVAHGLPSPPWRQRPTLLPTDLPDCPGGSCHRCCSRTSESALAAAANIVAHGLPGPPWRQRPSLLLTDFRVRAGGSRQHCCPRTCRTALAAAAIVVAHGLGRGLDNRRAAITLQTLKHLAACRATPTDFA